MYGIKGSIANIRISGEKPNRVEKPKKPKKKTPTDEVFEQLDKMEKNFKPFLMTTRGRFVKK